MGRIYNGLRSAGLAGLLFFSGCNYDRIQEPLRYGVENQTDEVIQGYKISKKGKRYLADVIALEAGAGHVEQVKGEYRVVGIDPRKRENLLVDYKALTAIVLGEMDVERGNEKDKIITDAEAFEYRSKAIDKKRKDAEKK